MGMLLFENNIPTGYSELAEDWISPSLLVERIKFVNQLAFNPTGGDASNIDPLNFFTLQGYETEEGIVGYLFELAISDSITTEEWDTAIGVLTDDGATEFSLANPDAEDRLRRLIGTLLAYPAYNYQ